MPSSLFYPITTLRPSSHNIFKWKSSNLTKWPRALAYHGQPIYSELAKWEGVFSLLLKFCFFLLSYTYTIVSCEFFLIQLYKDEVKV